MRKKKEEVEIETFMEENSEYVRYGKRALNLRGLIELFSYERQQLAKKDADGKWKKVIPINTFFGIIKSGIGWVSKNLEQQVVESCLEKSYRQVAEEKGKKLGRESIRQKVIHYGKKAEKVENLQKEVVEIRSAKLKNPKDTKESFKEAKGGILQKGKEKIQQLFFRRYLMADGVYVCEQDGGWRECKAGVILKQVGNRLFEEGTFCTWERVTVFRNMFSWVLIKIFSVEYEMVMISDGAQWIPQMREKIDWLKNKTIIWILDWFHLKEYVLKLARTFNLQEKDDKIQKIISALWKGNITEALKEVNSIPLSEDEEERKKQEIAIKTFTTYLLNQKEGIVDYEAYKEKGYLVGSGFMEKRNDTLIKKRMVHQKRMKWGLEGGEAMMQLLCAKMNGRLEEVFA